MMNVTVIVVFSSNHNRLPWSCNRPNPGGSTNKYRLRNAIQRLRLGGPVELESTCARNEVSLGSLHNRTVIWIPAVSLLAKSMVGLATKNNMWSFGIVYFGLGHSLVAGSSVIIGMFRFNYNNCVRAHTYTC